MTTTKTDAERINEYLATRPDASIRAINNRLGVSLVTIRALRDTGQINLKPSTYNWMKQSPILQRSA